MGTVVRDERMKARADYTEALKEARRKHEELCVELDITGADVDRTFELWLQGHEFDVESDGEGGSILTMSLPR